MYQMIHVILVTTISVHFFIEIILEKPFDLKCNLHVIQFNKHNKKRNAGKNS